MYLPLSPCLSLHERLRDLLFAFVGSKRKCAPTSVGVIGALRYLSVLPLYLMLHVYLDVFIVLYCGGAFWSPYLFCLDNFKYIIFNLLRHSHPPFVKMAAAKTNDSISHDLRHIEQ